MSTSKFVCSIFIDTFSIFIDTHIGGKVILDDDPISLLSKVHSRLLSLQNRFSMPCFLHLHIVLFIDTPYCKVKWKKFKNFSWLPRVYMQQNYTIGYLTSESL